MEEEMEEENLSIIEMVQESIKQWEAELKKGKDRAEVEKKAELEISNYLINYRYHKDRRNFLHSTIDFEIVKAWKKLFDVLHEILQDKDQVTTPQDFEEAAVIVWKAIFKYEAANNFACKSMETFVQCSILSDTWELKKTCLTSIDEDFREVINMIPISKPGDKLSFVTLSILLMPSSYNTEDLQTRVFPRTQATAKQIQNILRMQYLLLNYD